MGLGIFQIHALFINDGQSQRDCNAKRLKLRGTRNHRENQSISLCDLCASVVTCGSLLFFLSGVNWRVYHCH
jgi:hypothetical protein